MSLKQFMAKIAGQTYPEPRTQTHDDITATVAPLVEKLLKPGASILDIGSGSGVALEWFGSRGFSITGIDVNEENIAACKKAGYVVSHCDQNAMPSVWGDTFDCVWARHVLEHSIAPFFTLHEFRRILKPGGVLYVEVPAPDTACCHQSNENHYSVLGYQAWLSLITRAGLNVTEAREINFKTMAGDDCYFSFIAKKPDTVQ